MNHDTGLDFKDEFKKNVNTSVNCQHERHRENYRLLFFFERDIIGMQLLLILQKTIYLETCRVAHHGEFVRSIFEGLALLDFSDLEASIESTESTEMTDACGSSAGGKKRPVFYGKAPMVPDSQGET